MGFNDGFSTQGVPFVTGAAGGQVLTWDDTTSQWIAADPTGGGGGGTVETSGNVTGSGASFNKVRLKDDILLTSVTASFKGNLEGSASYANDADTLDGYQSSFFATTGSNIFYGNQEINGYVSASQGFTGSFSGSFIGDGSSLEGIVTSVGIDRIVYVQEGATPSGADGSITNPFATISAALTHASSSYSNFNTPVVIEIGPGSYAEDIIIDRYNTYLRSSTSKSEQRDVKIIGHVIIDCLTAPEGGKQNLIVGLEGLFIEESGDNEPTVKITGAGHHLTYFKDCYIYNTNDGDSADGIRINKTITNSRVVVQDCVINLSKVNPQDSAAINISSGDVRLDSSIIYYLASGAGTSYGTAIKQGSTSVIIGDRLLIEVSGSNLSGYCIDNSSSLVVTPSLYLSNSSLTSNVPVTGGSIKINNSLNFIWNCLILGRKSFKTISGAVLTYGSLSSEYGTAISIDSNITLYPFTEYFGNVKSTSLSASSGITGSFNGNGAGLTGILTSSVSNFASSVRSLFTGSGIISYNSSSGEISAPSAMTGVLTSGNITGSGVIGDAVTIINDPTFTTVSASSNMYVGANLYVVGTASVGLLETVSQSSLQIGDKYITVLTGADNHGAANGSGILWGSGSSDPTKGPEGSIAYALYKTSSAGQYAGEYIEIFPGVLVSGSLTASSTISSSAGFYGDGSGLVNVAASTFDGIENYATVTGSNTFEQNQTITGSLFVQNVISASQFTGSFSGSLNGNAQTADTATNALNLGGISAVNYALTGSTNTFTGNQTITGSLFVNSVISASQITGAFNGSGANVTNLTGSNWRSGVGQFFADVRDTFIFDTSITVTPVGNRYALTASGGGSGGSSAGSVLEFTASSTGSVLPLTAGTIVGVTGSFIRAADNNDALSSNIIGVISGTIGTTFNVVIAGEVSASISASLAVPFGGTPVYLSDSPGRFGTYDSISSGRNIVQVGIVSPRDNKIILQPRIFGIKG